MAALTRQFVLPFPPSVNHYYRRVGQATLISREGRRYRTEVVARLAATGEESMRGRLAVALDLYPPNRRAFDIDNRLKAALDAMEHAGVYANDGQIDLLTVRRGAVCNGGEMDVRIEAFPLSRCPLCGAAGNG